MNNSSIRNVTFRESNLIYNTLDHDEYHRYDRLSLILSASELQQDDEPLFASELQEDLEPSFNISHNNPNTTP